MFWVWRDGAFCLKCHSKEDEEDKSSKKSKSGSHKLMKKLKKEWKKIEAFIGQWDLNEESSGSLCVSDADESDDDG